MYIDGVSKDPFWGVVAVVARPPSALKKINFVTKSCFWFSFNFNVLFSAKVLNNIHQN